MQHHNSSLHSFTLALAKSQLSEPLCPATSRRVYAYHEKFEPYATYSPSQDNNLNAFYEQDLHYSNTIASRRSSETPEYARSFFLPNIFEIDEIEVDDYASGHSSSFEERKPIRKIPSLIFNLVSAIRTKCKTVRRSKSCQNIHQYS